MHAYNTSVHIQCVAIYDNTSVRDVNFMLSKVQMFDVYTYSNSLAKSMMTVFPWLYKFTSLLSGYIFCSKLLHIYIYIYIYICTCLICSMV